MPAGIYFGAIEADSDRGLIAGSADDFDGTTRAVIWQGGLPQVLQASLGSSEALGINTQGSVVGSGTDASGLQFAFRWTSDEGVRWLARSASDLGSSARAINQCGEMVGFTETIMDTASFGTRHAARWPHDDLIQDLNDFMLQPRAAATRVALGEHSRRERTARPHPPFRDD